MKSDADKAKVEMFKRAAARLGMRIKVSDERLAALLRELQAEDDDKPLPWPPHRD
jgi:RNA polymerase-interacting CarD/CdnL/TRCF family regulator